MVEAVGELASRERHREVSYTKPWESDRKVFKLNALQFEKPWDEQIYCIPSEENKSIV